MDPTWSMKRIGELHRRCLGLLLIGSGLFATISYGGQQDSRGWEVPVSGEMMPSIGLVASDSVADPLQEWARTRADRYAIPARALQAYGYATVALGRAQPNCHLGWTTLAAIGRVESDHGRHRGARIGSDGQVSPPIRGVPLDGTNGNARIIDPAGAERPVYARAAGPFQFIPDTWKRWGTRADSDYQSIAKSPQNGKFAESDQTQGNPDDIDDAALAAARYLCAAGGNLATADGWRKAIYAYNHSDAYVRKIYETAINYAR